MPEGFALFLTVAGAHALGVTSPGPDLALIIRQSLSSGRAAGLATALGIGTGVLAHVAMGLFALPLVLQWFPDLLTAVRIGGAAFLIVVGSQLIRSSQEPNGETNPAVAHQARPGISAFFLGFVTNLSNAKALLFFIAVCTSLLGTGVPAWQRIGLGIWMSIATVAWFAFVTLTIGNPRIRRHMAGKAQQIDRATGLLLIGLGLMVTVEVLAS